VPVVEASLGGCGSITTTRMSSSGSWQQLPSVSSYNIKSKDI
jgi:hypothetical protein